MLRSFVCSYWSLLERFRSCGMAELHEDANDVDAAKHESREVDLNYVLTLYRTLANLSSC